MWFIASRASCRDAPRRARASLLLCDAPQVIFHAALCEVASPDGVVGREWCYVEVKLPGRPIVAHIRGRVRVGHGNGHVRLREFMVAYVRVCVCGVACARGSLDPRSSVFVRVCMFVRVGAMAQAQTCEDGVGGQGSTDWVRGLWRSNRCVVPALVLQTSAQGYCAPRVNYEEVRLRVANAFKEKNHELGEMIGVIQSLSKDVARATDALRSQCR